MKGISTVTEFAKQKGVSRQTVYNNIKSGNIETIHKFGKTLVKNTAKNRNWTPAEEMKRDMAKNV